MSRLLWASSLHMAYYLLVRQTVASQLGDAGFFLSAFSFQSPMGGFYCLPIQRDAAENILEGCKKTFTNQKMNRVFNGRILFVSLREPDNPKRRLKNVSRFSIPFSRGWNYDKKFMIVRMQLSFSHDEVPTVNRISICRCG